MPGSLIFFLDFVPFLPAHGRVVSAGGPPLITVPRDNLNTGSWIWFALQSCTFTHGLEGLEGLGRDASTRTDGSQNASYSSSSSREQVGVGLDRMVQNY
ncbi:hypothetical protein EJ06DRAFT_212523 [Trichodelitschia bisporula]|uniref:Secreted protein n=1 Tax=Trichodelitschia bisporula TaxID=703511 RepID=A0A6G1I8V1_9PEZI|nr:hypothetical protein EJ06DRAFT_212523 [Trichodelitschia bisporula]